MTQLTADDVGLYGLPDRDGNIVMDYHVVGAGDTTTGALAPEANYIIEYRDSYGFWVFSDANRGDPADFVAKLVRL